MRMKLWSKGLKSKEHLEADIYRKGLTCVRRNIGDMWQTDLIRPLEQWRELVYMMLNLRILLL